MPWGWDGCACEDRPVVHHNQETYLLQGGLCQMCKRLLQALSDFVTTMGQGTKGHKIGYVTESDMHYDSQELVKQTQKALSHKI